MPTILNKNIITGTNWDVVGVTPDVKVENVHAFATAMSMALNDMAAGTTDEEVRYERQWRAQAYQSIIEPQALPAGLVEQCIGDYDKERSIILKDCSLYFVQKDNGLSVRLSYLGNNTFAAEGRKDWRVGFHFDGKVVDKLQVLWFDNTKDEYKKIINRVRSLS